MAATLVTVAIVIACAGVLIASAGCGDGIPRDIQKSLNATAERWYDWGYQHQEVRDKDDAARHRTGCNQARLLVREEAQHYGGLTRLQNRQAVEKALKSVGCVTTDAN